MTDIDTSTDTGYIPAGFHNTDCFWTDTNFGLCVFDVRPDTGEPRLIGGVRKVKDVLPGAMAHPCCPTCMRPYPDQKTMYLEDGTPVIVDEGKEKLKIAPYPLTVEQIEKLKRAFAMDMTYRNSVALVGWRGLSYGLNACLNMSDPPMELHRILVSLDKDDIPRGHGARGPEMTAELVAATQSYLWDIGNSLRAICILLVVRNQAPSWWFTKSDTPDTLEAYLRRSGFKIQFAITERDAKPSYHLLTRSDHSHHGWYVGDQVAKTAPYFDKNGRLCRPNASKKKKYPEYNQMIAEKAAERAALAAAKKAATKQTH